METIITDDKKEIVLNAILKILILGRETSYNDLELLSVGIVIALGRIEDNPVSMAEMSELTRIPRPTIIRKLDTFQSLGIIERRLDKGRTKIEVTHYGKTNPNAMNFYRTSSRILKCAGMRLMALDKEKALQDCSQRA